MAIFLVMLIAAAGIEFRDGIGYNGRTLLVNIVMVIVFG